MRRHRGLRQRDLAVLVGDRTEGRVSHYERGNALPSFPMALLLEIALGVRLAELYPELYRECQQLVLKRAHHLPDSARRSVLGRLLKEDITA